MSALQVPTSPATPTPASTRRPALVPSQRRQVGSITFSAILVAILAVGMFGLLMLQTRIQEQGTELSDLGYDANALSEREAALRTQLDAVSSPSELMRRASAMGMVPAGRPGYLMLVDGRVTGNPQPATGHDLRNLKTRNQQVAEAEAKKQADAKAKAEAEAKRKADEKAKAEEKARVDAEAKKKAAEQPTAPPTPGQPTPAAPASTQPSAPASQPPATKPVATKPVATTAPAATARPSTPVASRTATTPQPSKRGN